MEHLRDTREVVVPRGDGIFCLHTMGAFQGFPPPCARGTGYGGVDVAYPLSFQTSAKEVKGSPQPNCWPLGRYTSFLGYPLMRRIVRTS